MTDAQNGMGEIKHFFKHMFWYNRWWWQEAPCCWCNGCKPAHKKEQS